jgi:hypothetical protein
LVRDIAILGACIGVYVCIEQKELQTADLNPPDLYINASPGEIEIYSQRLAVVPENLRKREVIEIVGFVALLLPSGLAEQLLEISLLIEQPDTHEWQAEVACRL